MLEQHPPLAGSISAAEGLLLIGNKASTMAGAKTPTKDEGRRTVSPHAAARFFYMIFIFERLCEVLIFLSYIEEFFEKEYV